VNAPVHASVHAPAPGERHFVLPAALPRLIARLPTWPPSAAMALLLNRVVGRQIDGATLAPLCGRCVEIRVKDAGLRLRMTCTGRGFAPYLGRQAADVVIAADAGDFLLLARRQADPDSLFFDRRLTMEGDTELGLLVKNTLDGIDLPVLLRPAGSGRDS
jgi:predicted lipid carrier protein YhbT